jgi:hypothetical protein
MTNRIGPIPPESPRSAKSSHGPNAGKFEKKMRMVEEVDKVSEVELDKRGKRAFKKPDEEEGDRAAVENREPSPYVPRVHPPKPPLGFAELDEGDSRGPLLGCAGTDDGTAEVNVGGAYQGASSPEIASPRAPDITSSASSRHAPVVDENLPESEKFWEGFDLPDQPIEPTHYEEKSALQKGDQPAALRKLADQKKQKEMIALQKKLALEKEALQSKQKFAEKNQREEIIAAQKKSVTSKKEDEITQSPWQSPSRIDKKAKPLSEEMPRQIKKEESETRMAPVRGGKEENVQLPYSETAAAYDQVRDQKEREKKKVKSSDAAAVTPPEPLPPACQRIAEAAQTSASPFLNVQTANLFFQMVGTMVFMGASKEGISLTEVVLNSPAFKNSVFFNSTIVIEKYATAPDSFNIRLIGTPEAVQFFSNRNNVENLSSAFITAYEDRRISFRIGRIEAELSPHRHLIRRKKEGGDKENLK